MSDEETTIIELTEENIKSMIYIIREQKVMLDFDLARIYGYETKYLNRQVQRNKDKFPDDFMFKITRLELDNLVRCQNVTSRNVGLYYNQAGGTRYLPYAFTEQGIYMLMTVLKGELATKQSIELIRLFKKMKDYIVENIFLPNSASLINDRFLRYDKRLDLMESKLDVVMSNFANLKMYKQFIFVNSERIEADIAYQTIYSSAKHSIIIIDDYISIKTLRHLKVCPPNISIMIFSDNVSKDKVTDTDLGDFYEDTGIRILMMPTNNEWHDRFIIIDYKKDSETIYTSGSSSKDTGNKTTTIIEVGDKDAYYTLFDNLFGDIKIL